MVSASKLFVASEIRTSGLFHQSGSILVFFAFESILNDLDFILISPFPMVLLETDDLVNFGFFKKREHFFFLRDGIIVAIISVINLVLNFGFHLEMKMVLLILGFSVRIDIILLQLLSFDIKWQLTNSESI